MHTALPLVTLEALCNLLTQVLSSNATVNKWATSKILSMLSTKMVVILRIIRKNRCTVSMLDRYVDRPTRPRPPTPSWCNNLLTPIAPCLLYESSLRVNRIRQAYLNHIATNNHKLINWWILKMAMLDLIKWNVTWSRGLPLLVRLGRQHAKMDKFLLMVKTT